MALATQCPHCHTTFRVASDQLKLRGGIVRCGSCQRIFDGNAHLIDLEALAARKAAEAADAAEAPAPAPALPEPAPGATAEPVAAEPAARTEPTEPGPEPEPEHDADAGNEPVYTLDFDHTFDPFGILPKIEPAQDDAPPDAPDVQLEAEAQPVPAPAADAAAADSPEPAEPQPDLQPEREPEPEPEPEPAPAHAYAPAGRIEPSFELPVDEELVAQPLPGDEPEAEPAQDAAAPAEPAAPPRPVHADIPPAALPLRASSDLASTHPAHGDTPSPAPKSARAKAVEARARRSKMTPTRIDAPKLRVPAEPDEPEFVKRSRRQEQSGKLARNLMAAGALVLLVVLVLQLSIYFRNELAVRHPAARPLLSGLCAVAGCRVGLPTLAENLVIDDGELATLAPDTYSLNTQLRNQGSLVLAWPSIELELTDANNKPLLRRVFGPADYLPPGTPAAAGFGAHAEQPVRLNFALTDVKPSGYHTFVFYP